MTQENDGPQNIKLKRSRIAVLRKWAARFAIASLLASNFATLVNAKAHDFMYSGVEKALETVGLSNPFPNSSTNVRAREWKEKNKKLSVENDKLRRSSAKATEKIRNVSAKAKDVSSKVSKRLLTSASLNLEALPTSAIPAVGTAASVAVVGAEIYLACENMKDINSLLVDLGVEQEGDNVCGMKPPTVEEVVEKTQEGADAVIADVKQALDKAWTEAENAPENAAKATQRTIDAAVETYNGLEGAADTARKAMYDTWLVVLEKAKGLAQ